MIKERRTAGAVRAGGAPNWSTLRPKVNASARTYGPDSRTCRRCDGIPKGAAEGEASEGWVLGRVLFDIRRTFLIAAAPAIT